MTPARRGLVPVVLSVAVAVGAAAPASAEEVELPVLHVDHALPDTGLNQWQIPLAVEDPEQGTPSLVRTLHGDAWRYHQSHSATGDFGDVTGSDDGSADQLLAHQQPGGGLGLWVIGGGGDAAPQLWADLRTGGWSWLQSTQLVGDVDGDGLDDVVSVHENRVASGDDCANIWVHRNTGGGFADPVLWRSVDPRWHVGAEGSTPDPRRWFDWRFLLGDVDGDGRADLVSVHRGSWASSAIVYGTWLSTGTGFATPTSRAVGSSAQGWSFSNSRDLLADVDGDGRLELVDVHAQPSGSPLVWLRRQAAGGTFSSEASLMADLRTGGWSYGDSRQSVADVDGDGADDLVSVHGQLGGGLLVWTHPSVTTPGGTVLDEPEVVADLRTGNWHIAHSRESVGGHPVAVAPAP